LGIFRENGPKRYPCTEVKNETLRVNRAMVAMLLGCSVRRSELLPVTVKTIQQRQAPLSDSPDTRIGELSRFIFCYFYVLSLEYQQALSSSI
jgi:hypothetical protein